MKLTATINKFKNKLISYYSNKKLSTNIFKNMDILYFTGSNRTLTLTNVIGDDKLEEIANSKKDCLVIAAALNTSITSYNLALDFYCIPFINAEKTIYIKPYKPYKKSKYIYFYWNGYSKAALTNGYYYKFEYIKNSINIGKLTNLSTGDTYILDNSLS